MLFNSLEFILIFLPITLIGFHLISNKKLKLTWITIFSLIFYGYWNWKFIGLIILSIIIDYLCGKKITELLPSSNARAKKWMLISIISNLAILAFFKYCDFFINSFNFFIDTSQKIELLNIILPVGISFYTFQSMSYSIDLYRGEAKPTKSFLHFTTYVTLFPQMIAGPIVRYKSISQQINNLSNKINWELFYKGLFYFALGLSRKILIADTFAKIADPFFNYFSVFQHGFVVSWLGLISYSLQIYFDFSAYSEMAIGLGLMIGFIFPINFNSPYRALSFSDFWSRWHIPLSEFLRDNLYIPMGGNRKGSYNTYKFLMITMLIGGLWHGASWMFVIWGALHGVYLAVERLLIGKIKKRNIFYSLFVYFSVCIAWIFFRSNDVTTAYEILKSCLFINGVESFEPVYVLFNYKFLPEFTSFIPLKHILFIVTGLFLVFFMPNVNSLIEKNKIYKHKYSLFLIAIILIIDILFCFQNSPFIYFQF